jgi:hypothetical protein
MRHPFVWRACVALVVTVLVVPLLPSRAAATTTAEAAAYLPPVDAPLVDVFRPPPSPYGPGNRGIDYATAPGAPVTAAADGVVTFAGQVGGTRHVVVLHGDGVRTSYSFLATTAVKRGEELRQGQVVGTAGPAPLHFGARLGEAYIDPVGLFVRPRARARLLPDDGKGLPPVAQERGALVRLIGTLGRVAVRAAIPGGPPAVVALPTDPVELARVLHQVLPDESLAPVVASLLQSNSDPTMAVMFALVDRQLARGPCTPRSVPAPVLRPNGRRRVAVLVGGLGSSSGHASILDVPTDRLGYRAEDTVQFSYRGGSTADHRYGPADTQIDPAESGRRLRELLDRLAAEHPGVPIDVFAHSQGGLVARAALGRGSASGLAGRDVPPPVAHLITYGTPHDGADLAEAIAAVTGAPSGGVAAQVASAAGVRPLGLDPTRPSIGALAPGSAFVHGLDRAGLPPGVRVTSIAARRDLVVPAHRSWLPGAENVVVPGHGVNAHARVPGSKEAVRETALALADRPPTCESAFDAALDAATATAVQLSERTAVTALRGAAR